MFCGSDENQAKEPQANAGIVFLKPGASRSWNGIVNLRGVT